MAEAPVLKAGKSQFESVGAYHESYRCVDVGYFPYVQTEAGAFGSARGRSKAQSESNAKPARVEQVASGGPYPTKFPDGQPSTEMLLPSGISTFIAWFSERLYKNRLISCESPNESGSYPGNVGLTASVCLFSPVDVLNGDTSISRTIPA
jgi:hypothetical protein